MYVVVWLLRVGSHDGYLDRREQGILPVWGSFGGVIVELSLVMIPSHFKISPNDGFIGLEAATRGLSR